VSPMKLILLARARTSISSANKPNHFSCFMSRTVSTLLIKVLGRFTIENDTKRCMQERDQSKAKQDDQDYNNKMFLVVRSLKVGSKKVVSNFMT
jgi:hypothetical protein